MYTTGAEPKFYTVSRAMTKNFVEYYTNTMVPEHPTLLTMAKMRLMQLTVHLPFGARVWRNIHSRMFRSWMVKHGHPEMHSWPLRVFDYAIILYLAEMDAQGWEEVKNDIGLG